MADVLKEENIESTTNDTPLPIQTPIVTDDTTDSKIIFLLIKLYSNNVYNLNEEEIKLLNALFTEERFKDYIANLAEADRLIVAYRIGYYNDRCMSIDSISKITKLGFREIRFKLEKIFTEIISIINNKDKIKKI